VLGHVLSSKLWCWFVCVGNVILEAFGCWVARLILDGNFNSFYRTRH